MTLRLRIGQTVRICGHRGGLARAPENTLAALRQAHADGAQACEIDIRLTADHRLVLMHDATLDRTTNGTGALEARTALEISKLDAGSWFSERHAGEIAPTFEAAANLARALGLWLRVELKDYDRNDVLFPALLRAFDAIGRDADIVFCSFDFVQLAQLKDVLSDALTMGIVWGRLGDGYRAIAANRLDGLSVQPQFVADADLEALHDLGAAVSCFASDAILRPSQAVPEYARLRDRMMRWASSGAIDMITADDVAAARATFL